jgi:elongation factor Ts
MTISASLVKELRERTGAGMMECKKALGETQGDLEAAVEHMRKTGLAKADKKAGRVAAEGTIAVVVSADASAAALLELNCETDFVAKGDDFIGFAKSLAETVLKTGVEDAAALLDAPFAEGKSVNVVRQEMVAKIGENIQVRRAAVLKGEPGQVAAYSHGTRIGVVMVTSGGTTALGRDIAMHIAASKPQFIEPKEVPADLVAKEREILLAQADTSGKPQNIIDKMVDGRINKFLSEITLVGQPFVKDPDQTVGKLLAAAGAKAVAFARFEVGEGIEKKQENFADEVMAQVRASS